jgi:hypothetical protein
MIPAATVFIQKRFMVASFLSAIAVQGNQWTVFYFLILICASFSTAWGVVSSFETERLLNPKKPRNGRIRKNIKRSADVSKLRMEGN